MKFILATLILTASMTFAKTHVRGYTRKNGAYVHAHNRTDRNHTKRDNWSTKGNVNPETGRRGIK